VGVEDGLNACLGTEVIAVFGICNAPLAVLIWLKEMSHLLLRLHPRLRHVSAIVTGRSLRRRRRRKVGYNVRVKAALPGQGSVLAAWFA